MMFWVGVMVVMALPMGSAFFTIPAMPCGVSSHTRSLAFTTTKLYSSYYGSNDEDEDEEEDEDDEDYEDYDDLSVADFRSKMDSLFGDQGDASSSSSDTDFLSAAFDEGSRSDSDNEEDADGIGGGVEELIRFAREQSKPPQDETTTDWAHPASTIVPGTVLVANPAKFCQDFDTTASSMGVTPSPRLLAKFGLTLPPPADLGADRRADLLPVLIVVEQSETESESSSGSGGLNNFFSNLGNNLNNNNNNDKGTVAVLLNRRTGYLLGDLEPSPGGGGGGGAFGDDPSSGMGGSTASADAPTPPLLEKFCIQPLWFGGVDNLSPGLDMLHLCPTVQGATALTDDGLFWGGEPTQAQDAMEDPELDRIFTGFDFKFFVQATRFGPGELQQQIDDDIWYTAQVSKEVLFKSRDRMGTQRAKPLWTEIMELLGGKCLQVRNQLYKDEV